MEKYQYLPLPDARHIRCVTILPGSFEDDIVLTLCISPFQENSPPKYEALSYVWGSEEHKRPVFIHGAWYHGQFNGPRRVIMVTKNLEVALRHLRRRDGPRVMWVDAVCINQEDNVEKGPQVALMGDLYRLATRVVVFLGASEQHDDSTHAMNIVRFVGDQVEVDWKTHGIAPRPGCVDSSMADQHAPLNFPEKDNLAMCRLFARQWFKRLWIRQEIYLANAESAMVVCGFETVSWVDLRAAMFVLSLKCKPTAAQEVNSPGDGRENASPSARALAFQLASLQTFIQQNVPTHLTSLREDFGSARCSNPRDRVFATLSMLLPQQRALFSTPDYTRSTTELYADTVLAHVQYSATLNILAECDLQQRRSDAEVEDPLPPTWVPDWSRPSMSGNGFISTFASCGLAAWYEKPQIQQFGNGTLRVAGIPIGDVIDDTEPAGFSPHEVSEHSLRRILELLSLVECNDRRLSLNETYPDGGGTVLDAWIRTLVCDDFDTSMIPLDDFLPSLKETKRLFEEEFGNDMMSVDVDRDEVSHRKSLIAAGSKYAARVSHVASGKQLFFMASGRLGLGPHSTQAGDRVYALLGCDFLIVLRPCPPAGGEVGDAKVDRGEPRSFRVVGPAFMCGLTEGEAFLGPLSQKIRRAYIFSDDTELYEPGFTDVESGMTFTEDPRLSGLLPDDILEEHRGRLKQDAEARLPMDPSAFRGRGLRFLDLI